MEEEDIHQFEKPSVTADIVIFTIKDNDLKVLLVKRKIAPFKDTWALPGGFVRINESLEDAAKRELEEETGVKDVYLEQLYSFGDPKRDPRGRVITIPFLALIDGEKVKLHASSDAEFAKWHSAYSLPQLGFDHKKIIDDALKHLRSEIENTNIAFQIMPEKFTLSELQRAYEIILDKKLDKRNFRKKLKELNILEQLFETKMEGAHRPAKLYSFKEKEYKML